MTNLEFKAIAIKEINQSQFVTPRQLINVVGSKTLILIKE